jgi:hypothetical protein
MCYAQYCLFSKEAGLKEVCLRRSLVSRRLIFQEAGLKEACFRGGLASVPLVLSVIIEFTKHQCP